jgi:pyruvate formate-lyase activating enzyme-like uncharacterized protein
MITRLIPQHLNALHNPAFEAYAAIYQSIYSDFLEQIAGYGLPVDRTESAEETNARLERLQAKGVAFRNDGKSLVVNRISPACEACQTGVGSSTFFISLKCHRDCFYCFNPNQENYAYHHENQRDVLQELEQVYQNGFKVKHLALTGGEPLLFKEQTTAFFNFARTHFTKTYNRLYTSGDQADAQTLQNLAEAGLDEIRFSIRMHDLEKGHRLTFDRIELAKQFIPHVMVEMPVLPDTFEVMKGVLCDLDRLGIDSINLLEFCFPLTNAEAFRQRGYRIKYPPYEILYDYWYAGGLPIAGSELECLDLLEFALDEGMNMGLHYCSLENKHTGQLYQQNHGQPMTKTMFFSHKDYFLKSAKVFGGDIPLVIEAFKKMGYQDYQYNQEHDYLEFHVRQIHSLRKLDIEVGVSSMVVETRNAEKYYREVCIDLTTPQSFDLKEI